MVFTRWFVWPGSESTRRTSWENRPGEEELLVQRKTATPLLVPRSHHRSEPPRVASSYPGTSSFWSRWWAECWTDCQDLPHLIGGMFVGGYVVSLTQNYGATLIINAVLHCNISLSNDNEFIVQYLFTNFFSAL